MFQHHNHNRGSLKQNHLSISTGTKIPPQATLVFEVLLVDLFNTNDDMEVVITRLAKNCTRKTVKGDYIRYHYNGTFLDGSAFDSRYAAKTSLHLTG